MIFFSWSAREGGPVYFLPLKTHKCMEIRKGDCYCICKIYVKVIELDHEPMFVITEEFGGSPEIEGNYFRGKWYFDDIYRINKKDWYKALRKHVIKKILH